MGDFDDQIEDYQKFRADVLAQLTSLERGELRFINGVDRTQHVKDRPQSLLLSLDALIASYEAHNADRP
jgi:hypothetical protein